MNSKILIVYEYQILFEILNEIKENLNFEMIKSNNNEFINTKFDQKSNYLIISSKKQRNLDNCLALDKVPIKLEKVIELININFLKNKFSDQSDLKIGKYKLDLNSRKIILNNKTLNLTERETNLIIFINQKGNVSIKESFIRIKDGELYLIGSDETEKIHTYREIIDKLISLSPIDNISIKQVSEYTRPTTVPRLIGDTSKFRKLTGWKPEISIDKILEDTLEYWRNFVKNNDY